ncbi:FHA domain-containing protein [Streptomyces sp. SBT349]|uniref:FHA domain-containing protein n=1 Tax=Streptomyces sp. SBT349 TaxID=1580539 RepID=UPI003B6349AF
MQRSGSTTGPSTAPIPPVQQGELCPQCRTPREAQAPFCEGCRYNFLTNSPTTYIPPVPPGGGPGPEQRQAGYGFPGPTAPPSGPPQQSGDWVLPPPSAPMQQPMSHPMGQQMPPQQAPPGYPGMQQPPHQQPPHQQPGHHQPPHQQPPHQQHQQNAAWMVTVGPDPGYFTAMMHRSGPEAAQLTLPSYAPEQHVRLAGPQVTIGRRRQSTGESPDIDLGQPPEDPGVSHQHALLVQQPDGSWAVVDQDSTNGTTVNGAEDPIQPYVPVPLQEGDRIHIGAWTTLTLYRG